MPVWLMRLRVAALCSFVVFAIAACGDDEPEKESPACSTAEDCGAGYECIDESCAAIYACDADGTCERGTCVEGACVNPDTCDIDDACIPGFGCIDGACQSDPCAGVECSAGVCSPDTGQCVNRDICTEATEEEDCLEDFYCSGQACVSAADICAEVACELGACDPATESCVNPDTCAEDTDCLANSFCDDGACVQNVCDADMVMCSRGVCEDQTGDCVNPDSCSVGTDCVNGFYCISGSCTAVSDACEACEGNQICDYDGTDAVTCSENPAGCRNAIDCDTDRICRDGACGAPVACAPDAFEPNESAGSAVDFATASGEGNSFIELTHCQGDIDQFTFDTTTVDPFTGTLAVALDINSEDIGLGELQLTLYGPDGAEVGSSTTTNGSTLLTQSVGATTRGVYRVEISAAGSVGMSGLRYGLFLSYDDGTAVNACQNAPETMGTTTGNSISGSSLTLGSSCVNDADAVTEEIYKVTVDRRQLLSATVTNTSAGSDLSVSIRSQCLVDSTEIACSTGPADQPDTAEALVEPGEYYVVVQGAQAGAGGEFSLDIELLDVVCTPGERSCVSGSSAQICRSNGTGYDQVTCDMGCDSQTGFCDVTEGDICFAPIPAANGGVFTGNIGDFDADYDPGSGSCASFGAEGSDVVFEVQANAGDIVSAVFDASFDAVLYVVRSCDDVAASCVAGVDETISTPEELSFTADTTGTYFIIGDDYNSGSSGSYTMTIDVSAQVCTPGTQQCNGAALETCNQFGTGFDSRNCPAGCDMTTTTCNAPPNSTCTNAIDVSAGGQFTGFIEDYTDDYDSTDDACGFSASAAPDATYVVNAMAGDVIDVSLTAPFSGVIYASTDCSTIPTSCVGGSSAFSPNFRTVAQNTGPIYLIVDSDDSTPAGEYTLDVSIQSPVCTPGNPACAADGVTLEYCGPLGLSTASYTCSTSCPASGTGCTDPTGDICFDALAAADGDTLTGDFDGTDDFNPGEGDIGNCSFDAGDDAAGVDYFYDVTVPNGQALRVDYTSGSSFATVYLLADCASPSSCLDNSESGSSGTVFYENTTGADQEITIVMDRTLTGTSTLDFTLDVDVYIPECSVADSSIACLDANTVLRCDSYLKNTQETCPFGCDSGLASCAPPPNDTCLGPGIDASAGGTFTADIEEYQPDFDPTASGCTGIGTPGSDAVYTITGTPGDIVRASLQSGFDAALYAVTDCSDVVNNCQVGVDDTFSGTEEIVTTIPTSGLLYVVADALSTAATGSFTIDIDVSSPVCMANSTFCQNGDVATCDAIGSELDLRPCVGGCDPTTVACNPVPNDTCMQTGIDATAGGTFVGVIDDFMSDYDPGSNGCTGYEAPGPDGVYTVQLQQGEILTASMTGDFDASLYVLTDCTDTNSCVDGSDAGAVETVQFAAPSAGTYYIIVDAYLASATGIYELEVDVSSQTCTPNSDSCDPATGNLISCNAVGSDFSEKYCQAGCDGTALDCFAPTNETCVDATNADFGGVFQGAIDDYMSDYDPGTTSCATAGTAGGDAVYAISATSGDTIAAHITADFNASIYLVTDCSMIGTSCVEATSGGSSNFGYEVMTSGVYYLVVDSPSGATGNFEIDIDTGVPTCTQGDRQCAADNVTLEYCHQYQNGYLDYECSGSCSLGACSNPSGEICVDPIVLQSGDQVSETFEGTNNFEIAAGTYGTCTISSSDVGTGTDYFYAVDLLAGQTLSASYTSTSGFAVMYLLESCFDPNTCIDNTASGSSGALSYTASVDEQVIIVMDRALSGSSTLDFDLSITVN